ncbi:MAG: hypothetical protein KAY32_09875 [Candidatus Eisenbacteria sp.]|nr:hypothetical protein [Candidatus Eisenbacteria bacterium]
MVLSPMLIQLAGGESVDDLRVLEGDEGFGRIEKRDALYCYRHFQGYQPLNVYRAEQGTVVHSEFRDGNVPAGHEIDRVFAEALTGLPAGVERVYLRSDAAGYDHQLLQYYAEGRNERFGVVEFAVGADVTPAFKEAVAAVAEGDWQPLYRWVEGRRDGPEYRFLAIREPLRQLDLPDLETSQQAFPFPVMEFDGLRRHKVFGIVTNRTIGGEELIWWHRIIHLPARVVRHARCWWIRLSGRHPSSRLVLEARARLAVLARSSPE